MQLLLDQKNLNVMRFMFASLSLGLFFLFMSELRPTVAFMDSMRYLMYFGNSVEGKSSIFSTWNQGQHRGLLVQIGVYLNALMFGFNVIGATYLSGFIILLTGLIMSRQQLNQLNKVTDSSIPKITLLFAVTFLAVFSFSNWELYSLDVGAFLFAKNLIFIAFWIFLAQALINPICSQNVKIFLLMFMPIIILSVAYGWAYSFAITTILCSYFSSVKDKSIKLFRARLVAVTIVSVGLYMGGGLIIPTDMGQPAERHTDLTNVFKGVFFALSSVFMGQETSVALGVNAATRIIIGLLFACSIGFLVVYNIRNKRVDLFIPFALIFYSAIHMLTVSYARGSVDPVYAMAPRYYIDFSLLIVGFFWLYAVSEFNHRLSPIISSVVFLFVGLFICGQLFTCFDEFRKAPYRHDSFKRMQAATLAGNISQEQAQLLQQPIAMATKGINVQRKYALGPYKSIKCNTPYFYSGHYNDNWIGAETKFLVKNCGSRLNFTFYIPDNFSARKVAIEIEGMEKKELLLMPGVEKNQSVSMKNFNQIVEVRVTVDSTQKPSEVNSGITDDRDLGLILSKTVTLDE
jgi:hypothetical protein